MNYFHLARRVLAGVAAAAALAACADATRSIAPTRRDLSARPLLSGVPGELGEYVLVCKLVAPSTGAYNFTTSALDAGAGIQPSGSEFTLNFSTVSPVPPDCKQAWRSRVLDDGTEATASVTVTEVNLPADQQVDSIVITNSDGVRIDAVSGTNTITVEASHHVGKILKYYNGVRRTPPPSGIAGCTPGYWKQPQHFDSWRTYATTDRFNTIFGRTFFSNNRSLLQALSTGGGDKDRFGRHATAALLNTANSGVSYGMTTAAVIAAVQAAIDNGSYDKLSDTFEKLNERGCPLN